MKHLVWLIVLATVTAGCTDDSESSGPVCDLELNYVDEMTGECLPHIAPSIVTDGLPAQLTQYFPATFSWNLDPGTHGHDGEVVHSMDSRIKVSMDGTILTNETGPDDWGTEIARQQHKNLPDNFTAKLSWDEPGTLYVKGYMLIDAVNVWTDLGSVQINPISATGNRTEVTISGGQPALSDDAPKVTVGDGVTFSNNHELIAYTLAFEGTGCPDGGSIAAGGSLDVDFLMPGGCDFTLTTEGSGAGITQGDLDGRVTVARPA